MPYAKNIIKVKVPKVSGFDKSHRNTGTAYVGELVPLLCDEVVPATPVNLRIPINVQLPPLVSDTYMNLKYEVQAFFCPSRLLSASFESFFCDFPWTTGVISGNSSTSQLFSYDVKGRVPLFPYLGNGSNAAIINKSALLDYLGFRISGSTPDGDYNSNPLLGYHLIWQEWYRNPRVQKPAFIHHLGDSGNSPSSPSVQQSRLNLVSAPYTFFHDEVLNSSGEVALAANYKFSSDPALCLLADGHNLYDTRQRNFPLDYFTGARPEPQLGAPAGVSFEIPEGESGATISISQIRAANSLQQFRERNGLPSPRLVDQVKARYGANLADGIAQRPICIGSAKYDVSSRGVDQTAPGDAASSIQNPNPFSSVAAQYGRAQANGNNFLIDHFVANEPGYIYVIGSLVPEVTYSEGIDPMFSRYTSEGSITDMACALLQNVGDQPVRLRELLPGTVGNLGVFGYQDRYADWMFKPNAAHCIMRANSPMATTFGSLSSFVLQRKFSGNLELSSAFLEIPKNYLDDVMVFAAEDSGFSYWYDCILQYKVSMPLAEWSIPSLQDPAYEHGKSVNLRRNGQIF